MALIATEEQKRELNDNGFTVIENLLTEAEVATLDDAIEEVSLRRDQAADLPAFKQARIHRHRLPGHAQWDPAASRLTRPRRPTGHP